jgi:phosphoribosyl 1,2-cyclic phosphodiesterase
MFILSLQSGSNGNSYYVESDGTGLLIDAGISGRQAELRLAAAGRDIRRCRGVFLSHDHVDHVRGAGIFHRKFGVEVFATERTFSAASRHRLGEIRAARSFAPGETVRLGPLCVESFRTCHDAAEGVCFIVDDGRSRAGFFTDLGTVFDGLADRLASLDAVVLESNYDPHMLDTGRYPAALKRRIRGDGGHISNAESARLLDRWGGNLKWAALGHLSEENNTPRLALSEHRAACGDRTPLYLAGRYEAVAFPEL